MMNVASQTVEKALLEAVKQAVGAPNPAGPLNGAVVGLYTAVVGNIDEDTVWADLTVATFTGYAASSAITWTGPVLLENGRWALVGSAVTFTMSGTTTTENVLGAMVYTPGGSPVLRLTIPFTAPDPFTAVGDSVTVVPVVQLPEGDYGDSQVIA